MPPTFNLRHHPLAMDPATVRRLCAESLAPGGFARHRATVLPFVLPSQDELLASAAREYLALAPAQRPAGTIRRLAEARRLDFHQLLAAIGDLQVCRGFATQEPRRITGPAAAGNGASFG